MSARCGRGRGNIYLKNGMSIPSAGAVGGGDADGRRHDAAGDRADAIDVCVSSVFDGADHEFAGSGVQRAQRWNMVTGSADFAAQNFGLDRLPDHDLRYDMADEYIDVVQKLWDSWDPDAIVANRETGVLIDPEKVHPINFEGQYYRSRGPLNSGPCRRGGRLLRRRADRRGGGRSRPNMRRRSSSI